MSSDRPVGLLAADQMAYRSRALAQTEPFTQLAREVLDADMVREREAQPGNFAVWANAAFTKGYCVRKVEEDDVALTLAVNEGDDFPPREKVLAVTDEILTALRSEDADVTPHMISDEERLFEVLDQVIGSEVRNRADTADTNLSPRAKGELEDYLTYWVVRGYALRAAEQATGAVVPA
jgi:hypothetical protein